MTARATRHPGSSLRHTKGHTEVPFAERISRLGTETAFAVSLAAAAWGAQGHRIYPFHLGDIDLPTPANIVEAMDRAIAGGKTMMPKNGNRFSDACHAR